jgi:hypothetical protein
VKSTLSLRTERLAELGTDDLNRVQAAAAWTPRSFLDCLPDEVPTLHGCTTNILCP